jgi:hypothetical protein
MKAPSRDWKRKIILIVVTGCAVALFCAGQRSEPDSSGTARVRVLEQKRVEAEVHKDTLALDAMFDDELVAIEVDGTLLSQAEYLARIRLAGPTLLDVAVEAMAVRAFGADVVMVDGTYREKRMQDGKVYVQRRRSIDTWMLKGGQWVCVAAASQRLR